VLIHARMSPVEAAEVPADLHRQLHAVPPQDGTDSGSRILHMDLHPDNVILSARGPTVIDWRNVARGPADFDVAMTAVILAQVVADMTHALAPPAAAKLPAFLSNLGGDPLSALQRAVALRRADPALTAVEVERIDVVAARIVTTISRLHAKSRSDPAEPASGHGT
jgi:Ser/Thr protein kinase RdoA (MazF antagonist)